MHFLVFDEAQRAWDAAQVAEKHPGQEINKGEEGGIGQWRKAVEGAKNPKEWTIHAPPQLVELFSGSSAQTRFHPALNLVCEIRYHFTAKIHDYVDGLLAKRIPAGLPQLTAELAENHYPIYVTRDLEKSKLYLRDRYAEDPAARYGLLASARDKDLPAFDRDGEFDAQGLELDFAVLCWGTDLIREAGAWSDRLSRKFKRGAVVRDPFQLRVNSYRVLLTRGRDGMILFVPALERLDETYAYLKGAGVQELG
jgi:hypothetical protein